MEYAGRHGFVDETSDRPICDPRLAKQLVKKLGIDGLGEAFQYGKYKDELYTDVIAKDPKYVRWLLTQCSTSAMRDDIENIIVILKKM